MGRARWETRKRLFEPFYTTKETGQGLGTSIIFGIVSRHGGEVTVAGEYGNYVTFRLAFPAGRSAAPPEEPS